MMIKQSIALAASLLFLFSIAGCSEEQPVEVSDAPPEVEVDEHAGHDHGPLGPNGGHLLHLEPSGGHAEWVHLDDQNVIQVFVDPSVSEVEKVVMKIEVEGQEPQEVELTADESLGEGAYSVESATLLNAIKMGEVAHVDLEVTAGGETQSAHIEHHEH